MHWKTKAKIQRILAMLPDSMSYRLYYHMQKRFGALKRVKPEIRILMARDLVRLLEQEGDNVQGKSFFELGTGWYCGTPLGLWLCGAKEVITVDLNPYLREELVLKEIAYLIKHGNEVSMLFGKQGESPTFKERLNELRRKPPQKLADVLSMASIQYRSPFDARHTTLPPHSVDCYFSRYVLQHIPPESLRHILDEARRILMPNGLMVHYVDAGDQFARADEAITEINFLQFDDATWERYAGNRYAYHNRLRASDYLHMVHKAGFTIHTHQSKIDQRSLNALKDGFLVDAQFRGKSPEDLATIGLTVVAKPGYD
jgi:SAM-dependent methyltransferase